MEFAFYIKMTLKVDTHLDSNNWRIFAISNTGRYNMFVLTAQSQMTVEDVNTILVYVFRTIYRSLGKVCLSGMLQVYFWVMNYKDDEISVSLVQETRVPLTYGK